MQRARNFGPRDEAPLPEASDLAFVGVDMRAPPLVQPGFVSSAKNLRLVDGVYETRRGLFAPAWTRHASTDFPYRASYLRDDDAAYTAAYATTYGGGVFSDPVSDGQTWIVRVCASALVFTRETEIGRIVPFAPGLAVSAACQVVQNFNELVIVRGDDETSLVWSGSWVDQVEELVPDSIPSGYAAMPNAHYGLAWRERLVLLADRDDVAFGRIAFNTLYGTDDLIYVNRGRGDRLRSAAPLGGASLLILKSQSAHVFTAGLGDLTDARLDEVPVAMQFDSPHTTVTADGRVWWLDRRGIRTARIAAINADNKVIVEVQVMSDLIAPLIRRINWAVADLFTAAVTEERIFFAVALDTETTPKTLLVWNRQNGGAWESYDQSATAFSVLAFAPAIPWLNSPRLFALDAAGRQVCLDYMLGEDSVAWSGLLATRSAIEAELITRGYTAGTNDPKRFLRAQVQLDTWGSTVALSAVFDGPGETLALGTVPRDRTKYFNGLADFLTSNINGDFHVAHRQDYSVQLGATPASGYAAWTEGAAYVLNDTVFLVENGRNYRATQSSTGLQTNVPGLAPAFWRRVTTGTSTLPTWASGNAYVAGMQVVYQHTYECIATHTASYGTDPIYHPEYWTDLGLDAGAVRFYLGTPAVPATLSAYHSADVDRDAVISFREFERVLEFYNYLNGTVRTGEYHTDALAYSGYAPGPGAITTYHSADTGQDGRIGLIELTRVIQLLNTSGGAYHVQAGTEDGFASGADPEIAAGPDGLRLEDFQTAVERRDINRTGAWCQLGITSTTGALKLRSVSLETHAGSRSNLTHA